MFLITLLIVVKKQKSFWLVNSRPSWRLQLPLAFVCTAKIWVCRGFVMRRPNPYHFTWYQLLFFSLLFILTYASRTYIYAHTQSHAYSMQAFVLGHTKHGSCHTKISWWLLGFLNQTGPSQWPTNGCCVLPPHVTADLALINRQKMGVSMYDWKIPLVLGYVWSNHDNLILQNPTTFLYTHCLHWLTLKTSFHPVPWLSHSGSDLRCTWCC